jgi:UDP-glucose 4-epimerase
LAAIHFIPYCNAHPDEALQVNVVGTQNFLDACRRCPPARLVIISTAAVYPIRDGANAEADPVGPTDVYGLTKWVNERQLELYAHDTATRCAAARLFNVIGPRETNPHVVPEIVDQIRKGRNDLALGNVKPKRDYIHVADVASALLAIAQKNEQCFRAYNVGTGTEHSVEEIVTLLADITGRPLTVSVSSDRVRKAERMHLLCDTRRTREEIGWSARHTLESGLRDLWRSTTAELPFLNKPQG